MQYLSTRDSKCRVESTQAISRGISAEGGLFVPETLPSITLDTIQSMTGMSYVERAKYVLSLFLTDFTPEEIAYCAENAYTTEKFGSDKIAQISKVEPGEYLLELWHGPTCAFKDMALQILPYLLTTSAKKAAAGKEIVILVATSGDTGKAALEGFKDVPGTKMVVFYPQDGVSQMQKRQMTTQEGGNVAVCAIEGNFDDAQTGVKKIFTDQAVVEKLAQHSMIFSSANSINWGRLLPQVVYYLSTYAELVKAGEIQLGEAINVVVPTGNFGNILAAYYAKKMGLPVNKLICASNANNVLTDFLTTGVYDRNRAFYATTSPSMDILISSNLERLLYDLCGRDDATIRDWFGQLGKTGRYEVSQDVKDQIKELFWAGCCDDEGTKQTIGDTFRKDHYLCDTHTAVAVNVYRQYKEATGDQTKTVIASTASPYKFASSVLGAITDNIPEDEYEQIDELNRISGLPVPKALAELKNKPVRFTGSIEKSEMEETVLKLLGIG
ncbi:MAG TPA: threonine synthase [Candidatus Egerieicola faecale]|uniref:Threonine synthase n=1 Tax=Candidatus Egerieicola faecale TaxID=2840774 RepID=A0A9D1IPR0_9FIRM|nr:threonine synthase [Candidatus Egerieicola faecale]